MLLMLQLQRRKFRNGGRSTWGPVIGYQVLLDMGVTGAEGLLIRRSLRRGRGGSQDAPGCPERIYNRPGVDLESTSDNEYKYPSYVLGSWNRDCTIPKFGGTYRAY